MGGPGSGKTVLALQTLVSASSHQDTPGFFVAFEENARRVPLIAAIPKMFFPFLVILPGLLAIAAVTPHPVTVEHKDASGAIVRETTIPTQAEAEGKGLVPAKTNPLTGKIMLDASGKPICLSQFINVQDPPNECYLEGFNVSNGNNNSYSPTVGFTSFSSNPFKTKRMDYSIT